MQENDNCNNVSHEAIGREKRSFFIFWYYFIAKREECEMMKKTGLIILLIFITTFLSTGRILADLSIMATPRITMDGYYDDNIYFASKDAISDFVMRVAPGLDTSISAQTWDLDVDYEIQQVFYYHESARNSLNHFLDLDGSIDLPGKWKLSIEDSFIHSKDPVQISRSIGAISYENLKYDYNEGVVRLHRFFRDKGTMEVGYRNMFFKNRSSLVADTVNHFPYADFRYWIRPQYGVGFEGGLNVGLFDYSDDFSEPRGALTLFYRLGLDTTLNLRTAVSSMNFSGTTPDYDIYDFTAGVTHAFSETAGLKVGVGYYFQTRLHGSGLDNYDGISYQAQFYQETGRYSLKIEASKGYDEVYFDGEDLGFSSCYVIGIDLDYAITNRLELILESSYRDDTFPFAGGLDEKIKERTWDVSMEVYWHVNRWLDAGISLSHWDRDASEPDYEYLDNRAMFTLRLAREFTR